MEKINPPSSSSAPRRKRASTSEKAELLSAFETSEMTQKAFCAQHGLCVATFAKWRKAAHRKGNPDFVCMDFPASFSSSACVRLPNGLEFQIPLSTDPLWLARCVDQLHRIGFR